MTYKPLRCGCGPEYQCSFCAGCYACKHIYILGDVWRVKCPTGRIRIAYPDEDAQERVRKLREGERDNMGGEKNEPKTNDLTTDSQNAEATPASDTPATETPATSEVL